MNELTFEEFARRYCEKQESTPEILMRALQRQVQKYSPTGFMLLECQMMDSSRLGNLTILAYGPNNTFKVIPNHPISPLGLASDMSVVIAVVLAKDVPAITRCGKCPGCLEVERVKSQALGVLTAQPGSGEDVRLVWNRILEENPCTGFQTQIACTLGELYNCKGVDGFDDLIEMKLGHGIANAGWKLVGVDLEAEKVLIRVEGEMFNE